MPDFPIEPTHLPKEDAKIEPRGFVLAVGFQPPIRLSANKLGYEFAGKLSDYIDPSDVKITPTGWSFAQSAGGSPRGRLEVTIQSNIIQIQASFPTDSSEWFETRQQVILRKFAELFSPKLIVHVKAVVIGELPIDGDAREFLGSHIMRLDTRKLRKAIGRPIHVLGIRLDCPPVLQRDQEGTETLGPQVSVKAESLAEDSTRLYLEAAIAWPDVSQWNDRTIDSIVQRFSLVPGYLKDNIHSYLRESAIDFEDGG